MSEMSAPTVKRTPLKQAGSNGRFPDLIDKAEPMCQNCKFLRMAKNDTHTKECHRHAPKPEANGRQVRFPPVDFDFWCGEYLPKESADSPAAPPA